MSERRRIIFLADNGGMGGAERSLILLLRYLNGSAYEKILICPPGDLSEEAKRYAEVLTMPMRLLSLKRPLPYISFACRLCGRVRELGADIIHCNSIPALQWGAVLGGILGVPVVAHWRDIRLRERRVGRLRFLLRAFSPRVRHIAISQAVKRAMVENGIREDAISVVYNGVDLEDFISTEARSVRREFGIPPDEFLVGMVGRIETWKGHLTLLEAVARLSDIPLKLMIVGGAEISSDINLLERIRYRVSELNLDSKVIVTGYRRDVERLISSLDAVVVPSEGEPFGRVVIEGMAAGKPVIGTRSGGIPEIIVDGVTGFLVPPKDHEAIAQKLRELHENPQMARAMGEAGRERVAENFTAQRYVRGIEEIYDSILSTSPRHSRDKGGH
ncbi:MAG: glycosyltransferase family 4 protein [bacterium]